MLSIGECKRRARSALRGNWGYAVLACLLVGLIAGATTSLLVGPMMMGLVIFFYQMMRKGRTDIEYIFRGFRAFGSTFLIGFLMSLFVGLILFGGIIIGGVMSYTSSFPIIGVIVVLATAVGATILWLSFSASFYIKMVFPERSAMDCIKKSMQIMNGYKGTYFLLQLSFIGWGILSIFTFGIGYLFLAPYIEASRMAFFMHYFKTLGFVKDEEPPVQEAPKPVSFED